MRRGDGRDRESGGAKPRRDRVITGFEALLDGRDSGPFAEAPGLTKRETAELIVANLARVAEGIGRGVSARTPKRVAVGDLKRWHEVIFGGPLFRLRAGVFRVADRGAFTALIREGSEVIEKPIPGTRPDEIENELEATCDEWNRALDRLSGGARPEEAARAAARLYSSVCRVHPFEDGNLRAAWVALQAALRSFDWPITHFRGRVREHDLALGPALVSTDPGACEPFVRFLLERLSEGPREP